ncbi:MAG: aspartate 1-decarboxylase [Candidatus Marinimicrobia bacterium]|nr:aspartate 1-decarboxylase [Candidatus Neomarinimicrobiota bacterium]
MIRTLLKSKLHCASVTSADVNYEGSISIDTDLMQAADLIPYERVDVYDITNGKRFSTYVIKGTVGEVGLNGAAARLVQSGDRIIVASYANYNKEEWTQHKPIKLLLNEQNSIIKRMTDD